MASPEPIPEPELPPAARPRRRRLIWTLIVLLLLVLLALIPPLVQVNRLQRRIAASMSGSLGRPVHLDRVRLNVLPVPGFTLENLVVSEDPAFGYEPIIRANVVEITLRPSSLWRRQVELSTIRFVEPSLNLVRNAQGRWNIESLLMHAASLETAPTAQRGPGPAPRFPYIEARNARVNLKLDQEKQPFSLTEADFAVWLPSPQQWNIRIEAHPERTDSNVTETGTVRLEGSLARAAQMDDARIDMQASWHDAQLGDASRLLTGNDAGWRGTLNVDSTLSGTLRHADFSTGIHLNDVRRTDFLPAQLLDVSANCTAEADSLHAQLSQLRCALPVDDTQPVQLTVAALPLEDPRQAIAAFRFDALPLVTVLNWARLFSLRIPPDLNPQGSVDGELDWSGAPSPQGEPNPGWSGAVTATLTQPAVAREGRAAAPMPSAPLLFTFVVPKAPNPELTLQLQPVALHPVSSGATPAQLTLQGIASRSGYTLHLSGTATPAQAIDLSSDFPPVSDGVAQALPSLTTATTAVDLTCSRMWPAQQTCVEAAAPAPRRSRAHHHR
jgi:AsmA protein